MFDVLLSQIHVHPKTDNLCTKKQCSMWLPGPEQHDNVDII